MTFHEMTLSNVKKKKRNSLNPLSRHASLLKKSSATGFDTWLDEHNRRNLSVPDLHKLKKEWDEYQQSDMTPNNKITDTKMQIDLLNIRLYNKIKKPQMRLKMGTAQYYSKRSELPTGDWNEGFVFFINYHAQLFNTIEFDLYEKPHKHWPTTRHVGKAKLKISTLAGKNDIFVTFLPIYEYHARRMLPSEIESTLLETELIDPDTLSSRIGDLNLIGSVQVRIRYHFQQTSLDHIPNRKHHYTHPLSGSPSSNNQQEENEQLYALQQQDTNHNFLSPEEAELYNHALTATSTRHSSYGRGDLARHEFLVNNLFKSRLAIIMAAHIPDKSEQSSLDSTAEKNSVLDQVKARWGKGFLHIKTPPSIASSTTTRSTTSKKRHNNFIFNLIIPSKIMPNSSSGKRYGFSQTDSDNTRKFNPDDASSSSTDLDSNSDSGDTTSTVADSPSSSMSSLSASAPVTDRLAHGARKKAHHIIKSVNFGDRNFASLWMQNNFEDVALSHPLVDRLIGLVVSKQTQAMVRAIIKTANAFGQGFRITGIQLLKAALLIQRFYETRVPPPVETKAIADLGLIENACHYFGFALVAYGWRGLCYLGAYGQYVRGATDRRSNRLAIIRFLRINPEDLLGYEYALRKGASLQSSYYVAIDRSKNALVLGIRGTWSLYDAITDLVCEYMPFKDGLVHSGMLASAQWFYTSLIPQIFKYLSDHKNLTSLIITGHSLGGGVASLLTMMVADQIGTLRDLTNNQKFYLHCYNYAPAAVSSSNLCKKYVPYITSFVCQDDIVGKMSYGSAMKLRELIMDVTSAYGTLGGFKTTMQVPNVQKLCFDVLSQRRNKIMEKADIMFPSLYIPGKLVHIQRGALRHTTNVAEQDELLKTERVSPKHNSKIGYSLHYTTHEISNEMRLSKTCIEDHMITAYHNAFLGLREQYLS